MFERLESMITCSSVCFSPTNVALRPIPAEQWTVIGLPPASVRPSLNMPIVGAGFNGAVWSGQSKYAKWCTMMLLLLLSLKWGTWNWSILPSAYMILLFAPFNFLLLSRKKRLQLHEPFYLWRHRDSLTLELAWDISAAVKRLPGSVVFRQYPMLAE